MSKRRTRGGVTGRMRKRKVKDIIVNSGEEEEESNNNKKQRNLDFNPSSSRFSASSFDDALTDFDITSDSLRVSYSNKSKTTKKIVVTTNEEEGSKGYDDVELKGGPTFKDLGGLKGVLDELTFQVKLPLLCPEIVQGIGMKPLSGILLHGPPGCGKTTLAYAIANEAGVPFYMVSAAELVSGVSGGSEENIRELFSKAYRTAPSIIFIDEIDAIASKRDNQHKGMDKRIVTQLLSCMDEKYMLLKQKEKSGAMASKPGHVIVIGATNRPDSLDPAFRRSLRFDQEICLDVPNAKEALKMVQPSLTREGFSSIPNVTWDDVGGLHHLREELYRHVVVPLKFPEKCKGFEFCLETGFLLYGPPGCGKSLVAQAVANESGANFIHVEGPDLLSKYVGDTEKAIRELFSRARMSAPCIIFFDEVDALTTKRGEQGAWVVERPLNQLLVELSGGSKQRDGVIVIAATNRPDMMDPAVQRSGRFGRHIYVSLPDPDERYSILKSLVRDVPIDPSVDLNAIARMKCCEGLSGADLQSLVKQAGFAAYTDANTNSEERTVKMIHFDQALTNIKPSLTNKQISEYEKIYAEFQGAK